MGEVGVVGDEAGPGRRGGLVHPRHKTEGGQKEEKKEDEELSEEDCLDEAVPFAAQEVHNHVLNEV